MLGRHIAQYQPNIFDRQGRSPSELREDLVDVLRDTAIKPQPEPVELKSGTFTDIFIDGKEGLSYAPFLDLACMAIVDTLSEAGIDYNFIGGMEMGANQFSFCCGTLAQVGYFVVRKSGPFNYKTHRIEYATLDSDSVVVVVEDVVSTASSVFEAMRCIDDTGARIAAVTTVVDRADIAAPRFAELDIPYFSLATYSDLGIEPLEFDDILA